MSDPEYRDETLRWLRFAQEGLAEAERRPKRGVPWTLLSGTLSGVTT